MKYFLLGICSILLGWDIADTYHGITKEHHYWVSYIVQTKTNSNLGFGNIDLTVPTKINTVSEFDTVKNTINKTQFNGNAEVIILGVYPLED